MSVRASFKVEQKLIELKAIVNDLNSVRRKLTSLKAQHIGTFRQVDFYFHVPKGRLKLRVEDNNKAELVYYERENIEGPKISEVFILKLHEPTFFKNLLEKLLKTKAIVEKVREIYQYQGTKIHLDKVEKLGTFVEFERETSSDAKAIRKNREVLEKLTKKFGINSESLEKLSYSDLIQM